MHRPRLLALLALLALAAAGPLACGPLDGDGLDAELEPIDEEGFLLNDPEQERHTTAACPSGGNVTPATPSFGSSIDGYTSYVGQSSCSGSSKPGVTAFKDLVLATYPCTSSGGIVRGCSVGGKSEHKEGRAWDWMIKAGHPAADALLSWLLATDAHGNKHANARRLGIMYMIFNHKMWRAYSPGSGWQPYSGSNPHTDHVHFSFSWDGANKKTGFWSAPAAPPAPPAPPTPPAPPQPAGHPQISVSTSIETLAGQGRDFCQRGTSKGIFDLKRDQTTTVLVDVKNAGAAVAKGVRVGIWTQEPYLVAKRWNIYTDWQHAGSFTVNDTDGMQSISHTDPGKSFTLNLAALSPGETKRIKLRVRAAAASLYLIDHPDVRTWIAHVDGYYHKDSYFSAYTNTSGLQKQNGGNLRHTSQVDVIDAERCDKLDNDCDGDVDEGGVCPQAPPPPPPPSTPPPPPPPQKADAGTPAQAAPDAGGPPTPGSDSGVAPGWESDGMMPPDPTPGAQGTSGGRPYEITGACSLGGAVGAASPPPAGLLLLGGQLLLALARRRAR